MRASKSTFRLSANSFYLSSSHLQHLPQTNHTYIHTYMVVQLFKRIMFTHHIFSALQLGILHIFSNSPFTFVWGFFLCSCASCHSSCATCNGSAESQCITCRSGRFAHDGKCLNSCPDGYYADKKRQECVACPTGCATCSSNGFCLTCQENWTRNKKGKCIITGSENCEECEYEYLNRKLLYLNVRCATEHRERKTSR